VVSSSISAPAALVVARVMIPSERAGKIGNASPTESAYAGTMDAIVTGITDGLRLLLNIVATLIVFVALVALVNHILGLLPDMGGATLNLERLLGVALAPLA
jgi:CNT family concentrative nucleoside transporter